MLVASLRQSFQTFPTNGVHRIFGSIKDSPLYSSPGELLRTPSLAPHYLDYLQDAVTSQIWGSFFQLKQAQGLEVSHVFVNLIFSSNLPLAISEVLTPVISDSNGFSPLVLSALAISDLTGFLVAFAISSLSGSQRLGGLSPFSWPQQSQISVDSFNFDNLKSRWISFGFSNICHEQSQNFSSWKSGFE